MNTVQCLERGPGEGASQRARSRRAPADGPHHEPLFVLVVEHHEGIHTFLMLSGTITLGRADTCDVSIDLPGLAPLHLEVSATAAGAVFRTMTPGFSCTHQDGTAFEGAALLPFHVRVGLAGVEVHVRPASREEAGHA